MAETYLLIGIGDFGEECLSRIRLQRPPDERIGYVLLAPGHITADLDGAGPVRELFSTINRRDIGNVYVGGRLTRRQANAMVQAHFNTIFKVIDTTVDRLLGAPGVSSVEVLFIGALYEAITSGTFLDLTYLVRDRLDNLSVDVSVHLNGMFSIANTSSDDRAIQWRCDSFAALCALDYFYVHSGTFSRSYPGVEIRYDRVPFDRCVLWGVQDQNGRRMEDFTQKDAIVHLVVHLLYDSSLLGNLMPMNGTDPVPLVYIGIGMASLVYDGSKVQAYFALQYVQDLLKQGLNFRDPSYTLSEEQISLLRANLGLADLEKRLGMESDGKTRIAVTLAPELFRGMAPDQLLFQFAQADAENERKIYVADRILGKSVEQRIQERSDELKAECEQAIKAHFQKIVDTQYKGIQQAEAEIKGLRRLDQERHRAQNALDDHGKALPGWSNRIRDTAQELGYIISARPHPFPVLSKLLLIVLVLSFAVSALNEGHPAWSFLIAFVVFGGLSAGFWTGVRWWYRKRMVSRWNELVNLANQKYQTQIAILVLSAQIRLLEDIGDILRDQRTHLTALRNKLETIQKRFEKRWEQFSFAAEDSTVDYSILPDDDRDRIRDLRKEDDVPDIEDSVKRYLTEASGLKLSDGVGVSEAVLMNDLMDYARGFFTYLSDEYTPEHVIEMLYPTDLSGLFDRLSRLSCPGVMYSRDALVNHGLEEPPQGARFLVPNPRHALYGQVEVFLPPMQGEVLPPMQGGDPTRISEFRWMAQLPLFALQADVDLLKEGYNQRDTIAYDQEMTVYTSLPVPSIEAPTRRIERIQEEREPYLLFLQLWMLDAIRQQNDRFDFTLPPRNGVHRTKEDMIMFVKSRRSDLEREVDRLIEQRFPDDRNNRRLIKQVDAFMSGEPTLTDHEGDLLKAYKRDLSV